MNNETPGAAAETDGVGLVAALRALADRGEGVLYAADLAAPYEARLLAAEKRVTELEAERKRLQASLSFAVDGPYSRLGQMTTERAQERIWHLETGINRLGGYLRLKGDTVGAEEAAAIIDGAGQAEA